MKPPLGEMPVRTFLDEYWQKKPCLIRQAIPGFSPELDRNDVAGLACDPLAEARLVCGNSGDANWTQEFGPFKPAKLRKLPEKNWTLLVQDVEKHYPPLQSLLARFHFVPGWRLDDLMVSVAAPGGSVGPHVDQYDVFLLQAEGTRRWQIAASFSPQLLDGCELNVLRSFHAEHEWDLSPGDMLYLPPGIAHHGVAQDECMTWSIGLRAPSQADLMLGLGEWLAENTEEGARYRDRPQKSLPRPGELSPVDLEGLLELMARALHNDEQFNTFLGQFISRYRLAHQPGPPEQPAGIEILRRQLSGSGRLARNPWTRVVWIEQDGRARLFAAGEEYACSMETAMALSATPPALPGFSDENLKLLTELVAAGHYYIETS